MPSKGQGALSYLARGHTDKDGSFRRILSSSSSETEQDPRELPYSTHPNCAPFPLANGTVCPTSLLRTDPRSVSMLDSTQLNADFTWDPLTHRAGPKIF